MRSKFLAVLALAALTAAPVLAQTGLEKDLSKVQAGAYVLEPYHTKILFGVSHFGFSTYYGSFNGASGTLKLEPTAPSKSALDVSIPLSGIATENAKLDGELKSPDWFDAATYPAIVFKSTALKVTGKDSGDVTGNLTMHGVTKPVTLHVTFNGGGTNPIDSKYTIGFEVSGTVKRSDFGVTKYEGGIGDDVKLIISGAFEHS